MPGKSSATTFKPRCSNLPASQVAMRTETIDTAPEGSCSSAVVLLSYPNPRMMVAWKLDTAPFGTLEEIIVSDNNQVWGSIKHSRICSGLTVLFSIPV